MMSSVRSKNVIIIAGLLLVIAASRVLFIRHMIMNSDEIWSVWQTLGTPQQIIQWTPYDWPPLYYLTLGFWRGLVGLYPFVLKYLSVLAFLIGCAALYRVLRRLGNERAAFLVAPAYAALGYIGVLGTEMRGYALLLGLMPLTFWLMLRYFDHPNVRRAVILAACLFSMFYISLSSVGAFLILGIYTLIVYRQKIWRWWLPGVMAVVSALPQIQSKFGLAVVRTETVSKIILPPLPEALINLFHDYAGSTVVIWAIIFVLAILLLIYRPRAISRTAAALLIWCIGGMLLMYFLNPLLAFFSPRYSWWVMIGLALLVACGLARLPRVAILGSGLLLTVMSFSAVPIPQVGEFFPILGNNLEWLKDHLETGDVVVLDPNTACGPNEGWDYYLRTYFPNGLQFVTNPAGYRRVWYVSYDSHQDPTLHQQIADHRVPDRFVGPPGCLFRLYEAPPDLTGVAFANGMRFHGADVIDGDNVVWTGPLVRHEGETVHLRLWWSVDHPVDLDYSVGIYMIRPGFPTLAQVDSAPQITYPDGAPKATSQWMPGQYYVEERDLTVPYPQGRSNSAIYLAVYFWQDGRRLSAPGVDENGLLLISPLTIMAW